MAGLLTACSGMKDIPEDAVLLHRVKVVTDGNYDDVSPQALKPYVLQREQVRWFGLVRKPIVIDTILARRSADNLRSALFNKGYLDAHVDVLTEPAGKHKQNVIYVLHPEQPYFLNQMDYDIQDTAISRFLHPRLVPLEPQRFNVEMLDQERKHITQLLTNNGYYHFNKTDISFQADSTIGNHLVNMTMVLHPYRPTEDTVMSHRQYHIRNLRFLSGNEDRSIPLRASVLRNNTFITPGELYSASDLQNTYNHFGRLNAIRYTNINFTEVPDSNLLDCDIQLSTYKPSTISFQPEGTNTAGDLGAAVTLSYQNRNLFHGSEMLSLELRGAFEAIRGLEGYSNQNFEEYSAQARLSFPRFIAPFISRNFRRRINASSEVSLLYDLQNRPEFHRRVLSVAWRYKWQDANHHDRYQLDLVDLNYVFMPWISDTFRQDYLDDTTSRNAILRYNYEDLFIMKSGLGYTYNNGQYAIRANIETAGNVLSLFSKLTNASKNSETGQYRLFNIAYAQYVKGDFDYTRYLVFDDENTLAFHFGVGIAYPYGNSSILPFEKRYFSGGANSVRGWSVRSLGPGKYARRDGNIDFINQTGDMKLDINLEYRAHLFWKLGGALFIDAGNIWTLRDYADQPGGQFKVQNLLEDLAVSYGLGLRFNFDYFVLRLDLGMKAVNPAYEEDGGEHFPIIKPRLSRDYAFHFAVGMPF
ncbi:MAG: BamA/TamA family outer membrane protein [Prevotella sp.]|nr:BamA/TamA family outer membrane protein [Prevotella sp.]